MIMSDNDTIPKKSTSQINKAVFFTSALLIFLLVAFASVFPEVADKNFKLLQQQIFTNASWFYILAVALILLSVTFLDSHATVISSWARTMRSLISATIPGLRCFFRQGWGSA
jgi:choline-glycine betaine transporter